jgi:SET domain-containing protein
VASKRTAEQRVTVRRSRIHGRGVFAREALRAGDVVDHYAGEVIDWDEANRRYQDSAVESGHTFFFDIGDDLVIDGGSGGNSTRWINHGCSPNVEATVEGRTVVIAALQDIAEGEELLLDYQLVLETEDDEDRASYACRCGAATCRASMLAPVG